MTRLKVYAVDRSGFNILYFPLSIIKETRVLKSKLSLTEILVHVGPQTTYIKIS